MIYTDFHGEKLSLLGFGTMRLPLVPGGTPADIDEKTTADMVRYAMEHGVNYFDTAYPYHGGMSERVMGRVLKDYDRGSFYLATKYPGHQLSSHYDPAAIFEEQLEKCGVDYFDFYLLHNVYEKSIETYTDPRWGIIDYFLEQKKKGRIRHLGFSTHGGLELMERFLSQYGKDMEFCQIQLNYLDWTMQDAKAKCELLRRYNIPIWVMEPIRGGRLASLTPEDEARLRALHPEESVAAWAFRFLQGGGGGPDDPQRHDHPGADAGQRPHLCRAPPPDGAGGKGSAGHRQGHVRRGALHRLPLLLRRLSHGAEYSHAAAGV